MQSTISINNFPSNVLEALKDITFDHDMGDWEFSPISSTNVDLEAAMHAEIVARDLRSPWLPKSVHMAAALAELCYHDFTFSEKKIIGMYTLYFLYSDTLCFNDLRPFLAFQGRFLSGLPQFDPVLDAWASLLRGLYKTYATVYANAIITATLDFINSSGIENDVGDQLVLGSNRFPDLFRGWTGNSVGFLLFMFPQSRLSGYAVSFQALSDMVFWLNATNYSLSYYKEWLDGDTVNYISSRAFVEGKTPSEVFVQLRKEMAHARKVVYATFEKFNCQGSSKDWRTFENGMMTWHLEQDCYRLKEIGFGLKAIPPAQTSED